MKNIKAVLWVTHWWPSPEKPGQGIFIVEHAKALQNQGIEPLILCLAFRSGGIFSFSYKHHSYQGLTLINLELHSLFYKLLQLWPNLWWPILAKKTKNEIQKTGIAIEAVHSQVILPAGIIGGLLAHEMNLKHYLSEHWSKAPDFWQGKIYPFSLRAARTILQNTAKISSVSQYSLETLQKSLGDCSVPMQVIPNLVESPNLDEQQLNKNRPGQIIRLLAIANWNNNKNVTKRPDILVDCLQLLALEYPNQIEIGIVGNGNQISSIKESMSKLPIKSNFYGFLEKQSISKLYQSHHLLVHASNIETFSLVIAEALAHGMPVVASNVGAIPELINTTIKGTLVRNNAEDFKNAIKTIWHNYPNSRYDLALAQKDNFSPQTIGHKLSHLYEP